MPHEFERIAQIQRVLSYASEDVQLGIGDDAAVLAPSALTQVWSVDAQVDGVHFRHDLLAPEDIGYRAIAAALSDLAAMGARPRAALMAWVVPSELPEATLLAIAAGAAQAQREYRCAIAGGNLARGTELTLTTTVLGETAGAPLARGGARPGDGVYVTGPLGGAALGLALLLQRGPAAYPVDAVQRWRRPRAQVEAGLAIAHHATAAIDLSDGLLQDLGHLARASGVAIELDLARIPVHPDLSSLGPNLGLAPEQLALCGGEDYELAFTAAAERPPPIGTCIGRVRPGSGVRVCGANGENVAIRIAGFDHFE